MSAAYIICPNMKKTRTPVNRKQHHRQGRINKLMLGHVRKKNSWGQPTGSKWKAKWPCCTWLPWFRSGFNK